MPARTQELKIGIGFKKQTGTGLPSTTKMQVQTSLASADLWALLTDQFNVPLPDFVQEDDSNFYGRGDEYPRQIFPANIDSAFTLPFFLTSQHFAMAAVFGMGKYTEDSPASGVHRYICTPMIPAEDGVNLPLTTVVGGVRQGTSGEILDVSLVGMAVSSFTVKLTRGPGLQNSSIQINFLGSGAFSLDSNIDIPDEAPLARLGSGSASAIEINGVDYLANSRAVDLELTVDNGLAAGNGFSIGGGEQDGYDVRSRMHYGKRSNSFIWTVELEADSVELSNLLNGVTGPTSIIAQGALIAGGFHHEAGILLPSCRSKGAKTGESEGFVTLQVTSTIMGNDSAGPIVLTAITDQAGIGTDA